MSVAPYKGGGPHGHLGIIMTNEEYFVIAVDIFPVPNNPGPSAAVVVGMTAAVIAETTQLHREATQVYRTYHNVDQAIKKLIVVKLIPLPQPPVRTRTDARTNPSAQRATQLRSVLARVYAVSIQNQINTTVP
jgi:hypothetical protein